MSTTESYTVNGMTCDACARHVGEEVGALPGVRAVDVDLATGLVSVTADDPVGTERVRGAVEEAGYTLAS